MFVVICGCGIAGLALAQRLDRLGCQVLLVEKAMGPREEGFMMDFFGPGYDAAEAMGLRERIHELGYLISAVSYRDDRGRQRATLRYDTLARALHGRLVSIMRPDLEQALRETVTGRVEVRYGTSIAAVHQEPDVVRCALTDGTTVAADLLVGADGIHSVVRKFTFGPDSEFLRFLGYHTAAYTFTDDALAGVLGDQFCLTDSVHRQLGMYRLRDGRVATFAAHRAPHLELPADPPAALRRQYATLGWVVPRALDSCPPAHRLYYDQVAQVVMPGWHRGRVVLLGDAACAVSLLAGQGASMAIAGAYVLARSITDGQPLADGLRRYEAAVRPLAEQRQRAGRDAARWFVPASARQRAVRRTALRLARLPLVDRMIIRSVAGKPSHIIAG
ncbi:FAD-dependent monooxygenase [Actinoplanes sp. NPDC049668]|uniref:FAD-dependent monooxygenase n=1 Tax=unclassified Actinoplanes TaxID=2626549 RepID=UPI0033A44469